MRINIREDCVEIDGYVNAVERDSKPLTSRMGKFVERMCKGSFEKALSRRADIKLLLNHMQERELGSTARGNLDLYEDSIGLRARTEVTDPEVIEDAKNGNLVGWSFGFLDVPDGVIMGRTEDGLPLRKVTDLDLLEVSLLNRKRSPAYEGTLVEVRDDTGDVQYRAEDFLDDNIETNIEAEERADEPMQEHAPEEDKVVDYSEYEEMIKEMKGEGNEGTC